ncbi:MAG: hypothetical protein ACOYNH_00480 [Bacteroidia bacterium]|jgi:hypothetical protein
MEKKCLECSEVLLGRADKKFCNDLCRNSYNNKLNSEHSLVVRNVNNILKKNRKILEEMVPEETAKTSKKKLMEKGFNFTYITNLLVTSKGTTYYFCYEYGYLLSENDFVFLVKRKEKQDQN